MDNGLSDAGLSITGNSSSSYVMGPMSVVNYASSGAYLDTLKAPVGDGVHYSPVYIIPSGTGVSTWDIRYADTSTATISINKCIGNFKQASLHDMFHVRRSAGGEDAKLRFYWNSNSDIINGATINDLIVVHYNKPKTCWEMLGEETNDYERSWSNKWIETAFDVTEYSPFAFASKEGLIALPIEILSFDLELDKEEDLVRLDWIVNELDVDYYAIERQVNQGEFELIGNVEVSEHSMSERRYRFIDHSPVTGISNYRLKIRNLNGSFIYSTIKTIVYNSNNVGLKVAGNSFMVQSKGEMLSLKKVSIIDVLGRVVERKEIQVNNWEAISVKNGVYFLVLEDERNRVEVKKLVL